MPSPYSIPAPYSSPYGESIADLMMRQGDIAAQRAGAGGAIWGQALSNIGQIVGGAIEKHQEKKEQSKRDQALSALIGSDVWATDPQAAFAASAKILGPREGPKFAEGMFGAMKMRSAQSPEEARQSLPMMARGLAAAPASMKPQLYGAARGLMVNSGLVKPEEMPEAWSDDMLPMVKALAGEAKAEQGFTLGPRDIRFSPTGEKIAEGAPAAEHQMPQSVEQQLAEAALRGDETTYAKLLKVKREVGAAARAPKEPKEERLIPRDVFNQETGEMETTFLTESQARAIAEGKAPALGKGPGTTERNRMGAARNSIEAGEQLIKELDDPTFASAIGPVTGRYNSLAAAAGAGDPTAQYLVGALRSFSALQPQIHGFRAVQFAKEIEKLLSTKQTPESLKGGIKGILTASYIVAGRKPAEAGTEKPAEDEGWTKLPGGIEIREVK